MRYQHTQHSPLHYLLYPIAAAMIATPWLIPNTPMVATVTLFAGGSLFVLLAFCFHKLTVADEGDRLAMNFGPIRLFRKTIPYESITHAEAGRSSLVDGWGIHWVPGRGWTYNIWGFDCVVLHCGNSIIRVGSDDVPNLLALVNSRIAKP